MILPDGPPEEPFAAVAGRSAVVLPRRTVPAYRAVLTQCRLSTAGGRGAQRRRQRRVARHLQV